MSNNRWLRTNLIRSNSLTALAAGLLSLLLTFLGMRLWQRDLAVPFPIRATHCITALW